jgi:hypothetical protein
MKPRARRVAIAAAVLGAGVIAVLVVAHWGTVRNHVEAWHFQLTTQMERIEPSLHHKINSDDPDPLSGVSYADLVKAHRTEATLRDPLLLWLLADLSGYPVVFATSEGQSSSVALSHGEALELLEEHGYRIIEQCFPTRAYVIMKHSAQAEAGTQQAIVRCVSKHDSRRKLELYRQRAALREGRVVPGTLPGVEE